MLFDKFPAQPLADRILSTNHRSVDYPFSDLYALMRAATLLVDMDSADLGELGQMVLYAYLLDIPVFGIGYHSTNSPWIMGKLASFVSPKTTDDIVLTVKGYLDSLDTIRHARLGIPSKGDGVLETEAE
jgi:hypothetical protein